MTPLHRKAIELASAGVPVFPCYPGTKKPRTAEGFKDATTNLDMINEWWSEDPDYNVAYCPATVGEAVIDLDGEAGAAALQALELEHGFLPPSRMIRTPRGGQHLYFKGTVRPTQGNEKRGLGPKIDTRGVGSYVLVPPSRTADGQYELVEDVPLAPLPAWVGEVIESKRHAVEKAEPVELDRPGDIARARSHVKGMVERGDVAVEGQMGDYKTFVTACQLRDLGVSEDTCLHLMLEEFNPHCVPPWEKDELEVKVSSAYRNGENDAGAWAVASPEEAFEVALGKLALEEPPAARPNPFRLLSLQDIENMPEPRWFFPDFLQERSVQVIYGAPGSYKTFITLHFALLLASGIGGHGRDAGPGKAVVYVAGEGAWDLHRRVKAWCTVNGVDYAGLEATFRIVPAMPSLGADPADVQLFLDALQSHGVKPEWIILDTAARAMRGLNENDAKDVSAFLKIVEQIKDLHRCAVTLIHHAAKAGDSGPRGSGVWIGDVDTIHEIKAQVKGAAPVVVMQNKKQRNAQERDKPWGFEGSEIMGQLVFSAIDLNTLRTLTGKSDFFSGPKIGAALAALGAGKAFHTGVLAYKLLESGLTPGEDPEDVDRKTQGVEKTLRRLALGPLAAYCSGEGKEMRWSIPAVD